VIRHATRLRSLALGRVLPLLLTAVAVAHGAMAAPRSPAARAEFQRTTPCPATGASRGPCPGWVVDHRMPLCAGGEDHASNLQWQTVADAVEKDRNERRLCRALKR